MLEVAQVVAKHFPGTQIMPSDAKDTVQQDSKNEPDPYILEHWQPTIDLEQGIAQIVDHMTCRSNT
jgi:hypothetical protein